tara:strand:+ start:2145 stop:2291 length:147 start_codon:yes stop_codon:yes gene_type:complete
MKTNHNKDIDHQEGLLATASHIEQQLNEKLSEATQIINSKDNTHINMR